MGALGCGWRAKEWSHALTASQAVGIVQTLRGKKQHSTTNVNTWGSVHAPLRLTLGLLQLFAREATIPTARGVPVRNVRLLATAVVIITAALASVPQAQAQGAFAPGTVVQLQGTPHLWFTDHQGILHWGGDTRALAGRHIDWRSRATVSLERLRTLPRGDPWLSAGLLERRRSDLPGEVGDRLGRAATLSHSLNWRCGAIRHQR